MKKLTSALIALCAISLSGLLLSTLPGCAPIESDTRNDVLIQIAVTQGVVRFVDAGVAPADKALRRDRLVSALSVARQFVNSDQPLEVINWADEFVRLMDWNSLSLADQVLIAQVINLVRDEIDMRIGDQGARIYLGQMIDIAIKTASDL